MNMVGQMITGLFNGILLPFGSTHHTLALVVLSLLTGIGMGFVFKWTSNERAIRVAKDRLKARILEMRIYQDDPILILKGLGGTLKSNGAYLRALLKPMVFLMIPVIIVFMQMDERYSRRPLDEGARTILSVQLANGLSPFENDVALSSDGGIVEDSRPVRVEDTGEIGWRLRVESPGTYDVTLSTGDHSYTFPVVAEDAYKMIGRERTTAWIEPLLHPAMPAIPSGSPFEKIEIHYPGARYPLLLWNVHWIVIFIVYSFISALALKFIIKFEV